MPKTCPSCYLTPLASEWDSCPRCGQELARGDAATPRGKRAAIAIGVAALIAGGAFGGAAFIGKDADAPSVEEVAVTTTADPIPTTTAPPVPLTNVSMSNTDIAKEFGDSVYRLEAEGCGVVASGSSWVLDKHHLVTNWHVVSVDTTPTVIGRDGSKMEGEVIGGTARPDIAVVRVDKPLAQPLEWAATKELTEGQEIVGLGYPAPALDFSVTPGSIVSFQMTDGKREAIRTDGALDKGNSGGPVLTRTGQVAGVVTEMAVNDGFQLVPLLFTASTLQKSVSAMIDEPQQVEPDCDADFDVLPEGDWVDDLPPTADSYGDDPALDELQDDCVAGDMAACDSLYWSAGFGSAYESVATSCGGLVEDPVYGMCEYYAEQAAEDAAAQSAVSSLANTCEAGDMSACDELAIVADWGSDAYETAETCGGHYPDGYSSCMDRENAAGTVTALVAECQAGDMQACDDLGWEAEYGSDAAEVAETCGGHYPDAYGMCVNAEEDAQELQQYYDACAGGDMAACDDLYLYADYGSQQAKFGSTCGNRYKESYGMCEYDYGS